MGGTNRCSFCHTPISLGASYMVCKCGGKFCTAHRPHTSHNCTFDFRSAAAATQSPQSPVTHSRATYLAQYRSEEGHTSPLSQTVHSLCLTILAFSAVSLVQCRPQTALARLAMSTVVVRLWGPALALLHRAIPSLPLAPTLPPPPPCQTCVWGRLLNLRMDLRGYGYALCAGWDTVAYTLAYAVTFGKSNCLTRRVYTGDVTVKHSVDVVWEYWFRKFNPDKRE